MEPTVHEIIKSLLGAHDALLVALVAGAFSLLGLIVSKENKISEFRQNWIDALRGDVADLIAQAQLIHTEIVGYTTRRVDKYSEYLCRVREPLIAFNQASTRIKLRLNLEEEDSRALMERLKNLHDLLGERPDDVELFLSQFAPFAANVEKQAAIVLSKEWKRVKAGETGYRRAKQLTYIVLFGAFLLVVIALTCGAGSGL